jgi:hypothetical protein
MSKLNQLDKITALLQLVDKLATSLLRTHLVDKLRLLRVSVIYHRPQQLGHTHVNDFETAIYIGHVVFLGIYFSILLPQIFIKLG